MPRYQIKDLAANTTSEVELPGALRPATLLAVPYLSQLGTNADKHNNDCGAATGAMLLRAYQKAPAISVDAFYDEVNPSGDNYLGIPGIKSVLLLHGLNTEWSVDQSFISLNNCLMGKRPVMLLVQYSVLVDANLTEKKNFRGPHFVIAVGSDIKYLYVHDPYFTGTGGEARAWPRDVFERAWQATGADGSNPSRGMLAPQEELGAQTPLPVALYKARVEYDPWLNVRTGPGMNFQDIGDLHPGDIVSIYAEREGWGQIGVGQWIKMGPGFAQKIN